MVPSPAITVDRRENLHGVEYTTLPIGGMVGMIIELRPGKPEWSLRTLYISQDFFDGGYPANHIMRDGAGNLQGAATFDGTSGNGVVYQIGL